jgi:hypothetical protein
MANAGTTRHPFLIPRALEPTSSGRAMHARFAARALFATTGCRSRWRRGCSPFVSKGGRDGGASAGWAAGGRGWPERLFLGALQGSIMLTLSCARCALAARSREPLDRSLNAGRSSPGTPHVHSLAFGRQSRG